VLDLLRVVNILNRDDADAAYNLLADYARALGARYVQDTDTWNMPPTSGTTSSGLETNRG
jgi:hypothetical protein